MSRRALVPEATTPITSAELSLVFAGGAVPDEVPARDLNAADLARIARIRALQASAGDPVTAAGDDELAAIAAELLASGAFTSGAPAPEPDPQPDPIDDAPATPAAEQET